MEGFFGRLGRNLRDLPANLAAGLRPLPPRADEPRVRMRRSFVYHLHPRTVSLRALEPLATLGLGVASAVLFACLCVTGALLMIYYVPSQAEAHGSMLDLQHAVTFGPFLRALHRWAAHGMVVVVALHLLRVLAQAAYRRRELNWMVGLGLMSATLGLAFTGYLLPWDQRAYWAITVSANLADHLPVLGQGAKQLFLGGAGVGQATLLRFYLLHVALLPTGLLLLLALHLWRIRRDGGLAVDPETIAVGEPVSAWPHLVLREAILILVVLAGFCLLAALVDAPLGGLPDLHHPDNPEKAPWYFLWLQEMVSYSAPVGGVVYPGLLLGLLVAIPFLDREDRAVGRWFGPGRVRLAAAVAFGLSLVGLIAFEAVHLSGSQAQVAGGLAADLLNPAAGMILLAGLAFWLAGFMAGSTRAACLCAWIVLATGVAGFVLVGACRGPDWVFHWPWEVWSGGL